MAKLVVELESDKLEERSIATRAPGAVLGRTHRQLFFSHLHRIEPVTAIKEIVLFSILTHRERRIQSVLLDVRGEFAQLSFRHHGEELSSRMHRQHVAPALRAF